MIEIEKVICIGANCIAADIMHSIKLRIVSPVDNLSSFNIWKSHLLFSGRLKKTLFSEDYDVRPSTLFEKETYYYFDKVFSFNHGFYIVHNDFENKVFRNSLKKRIKMFRKYYKISLKNDSCWYIYSLEKEDSEIDESFMQQIFETIPKVCRERLLCLGIRGKNPLFEKYFKYYVEINEKDHIWGNYKNALSIIHLFEKKYDMQFKILV